MDSNGIAAPCAKIELTRPEPPRPSASLYLHEAVHTVRKTAKRVLVRPPAATTAKAPRPRRDDESLGLNAGEVVEVKSADEIRETLDGRGMFRGLYFMGEMWKYCGQRFEVLKPVSRVLIEATGEIKEGIHDTVLLKGASCDGTSHLGCDGTCPHMWREVWLRRADMEQAPSAETPAD
jgi:hypothetical protein